MAKYNEVMEHIAVTEEMEARILENVAAQLPGQKRSAIRKWIPVIGIAAAAAILVFVLRPWNWVSPVTPTESGMLTSGIFHDETYSSARELGRALGFRVPDFAELPYKVTSTEYHNISGSARIFYMSEDDRLTFTKSIGTDDNSGVYDDFGTVKEITADGIKVTLSGEGDKVMLAFWTDGTYAYSIHDRQGISEDSMLTLIAEAMVKR